MLGCALGWLSLGGFPFFQIKARQDNVREGPVGCFLAGICGVGYCCQSVFRGPPHLGWAVHPWGKELGEQQQMRIPGPGILDSGFSGMAEKRDSVGTGCSP